MKRIRTIRGAMDEIREIDPNSDVSKYYIRKLCDTGKIPCHHSGNKVLLDFDALMSYLNGTD